MDLPALDVGSDQKKVEAINESGQVSSCGCCDTELLHEAVQVLLLGLASACVDNTTGDPFKSPASVAVEVRKEMVDYLTQRSETFVAESFIGVANEETDVSDNPMEIISDFMDDFVSSKRNLFGRVSGWLLSEKREDKIDDFLQEMEINRFWSIDRREAVAKILLENVDYKSMYHCDVKFDSMEELIKHKDRCNWRILRCTSEGCNYTFSAIHSEKHASICPFMVLPCEQKCSASILRQEMDRHCITVCPMKLINCPFYQLGCLSTLPRCTVEQHCLEFLKAHLMYVLHQMHKEESAENIQQRIEQLEKLPSFNHLSEACNVRSLTWEVKGLELELKSQENGPLEENQKSW